MPLMVLALASALPVLLLLLAVPVADSVGRDVDEIFGPCAAVDVFVELIGFVELTAALLDCVDVVGMDSGRADVVVGDGKIFELLFSMAWERAGDEMDVGRRC